MTRNTYKIRKIIATALVIAFCTITPVHTAFADSPLGPASDTQITEHNKNEATGPASQDPSAAEQAAQQAAELAAQQAAELAAQQAAELAAQQAAELAAQQAAELAAQQAAELAAQQAAQRAAGEQTADGKIMSGGRLIDPSKPMVALTFDDGPYAPVGNRIMDTLEQYNGRSTFFVVGNRVPQYKSEIRRMHDNGHEVANHTYEHKYLTTLGAEAIRSQIERCNSAIAAVTGVPPTLVRLPGGLKNNTVLANVHYPIIMWNIDTKDWKTKNAQKSINAVVGNVQDGDIVLMHELYTASGEAAATIIPALSEQGFQLVTVSEMARFRGGVAAGKLYNKFRP